MRIGRWGAIWGAIVLSACGGSQRDAARIASAEEAEQREGVEQTWVIGGHRLFCDQEGPALCVPFRVGDSERWALLPSPIEGLRPEEGVEYVARVRVFEQASGLPRVVLEELISERPHSEGCTTTADCPHGQMCTGDEGCEVAWTCRPVQPCTRDEVVYCACDGRTVSGSGTCPPKPFRHRGPC